MAALHFDLVSPERVLFSGDVDQVDLPGAEGDMGILAGHAPWARCGRASSPSFAAAGASRCHRRRRRRGRTGGLTVLADHAVALEASMP
jgi:F-type H+-transporting ATPase subunit epsilon